MKSGEFQEAGLMEALAYFDRNAPEPYPGKLSETPLAHERHGAALAAAYRASERNAANLQQSIDRLHLRLDESEQRCRGLEAAWGMVETARRTLRDYNLNDPSPERADVVRCTAVALDYALAAINSAKGEK